MAVFEAWIREEATRWGLPLSDADLAAIAETVSATRASLGEVPVEGDLEGPYRMDFEP